MNGFNVYQLFMFSINAWVGADTLRSWNISDNMLAIHLISFYFSKLKEDPTKKVNHAKLLSSDGFKGAMVRNTVW